MRRNSQHRPERESPVRERNDLRSQNRVLKRQVSRLKKQLTQLEDQTPEEEETSTTQQPAQSVVEERCPKCGSDDLGTYTLTFGSCKTVVGCKTCKKWHRTVGK